ncbi:MAG: hypothetical protein JWO20_739 [Candidatus Angelobacter sp.]|jgi:hypothetical protein|nr:hypothetical protein [Candidatus Angelobacter sp.]
MQTSKTEKCIVCTTAEDMGLDKTAVYQALICTCEEDSKREISAENWPPWRRV